MKVIKCPHCKRTFFDIGSTTCPFCKKNLKITPDIFGDKTILNDIFDNFGGK